MAVVLTHPGRLRVAATTADPRPNLQDPRLKHPPTPPGASPMAIPHSCVRLFLALFLPSCVLICCIVSFLVDTLASSYPSLRAGLFAFTHLRGYLCLLSLSTITQPSSAHQIHHHPLTRLSSHCACASTVYSSILQHTLAFYRFSDKDTLN